MEFHISRAVRDRLGLDELLFSYSGNVVFGNLAAGRTLAQKMNEARGADADPAGIVNGGALFAMGLIDELNHALVARYRTDVDPNVLSEAVQWFARQGEPAELERLLLTFTQQFPNVAVYQGKLTAAEWLKGSTEGLSNRETALEELLLLWIANINPAFKPFRELFEDQPLKQATIYQSVTESFPAYFSTRPAIAPEIGTLLDALCAPMLASPDSLTGQLDFMRENWTQHLGEDLKRVLLAIATVREEDIAIWMRFNPPAPDQFRHGAPGFGGEGFVGDEYVGFDQDFAVGPDGVRHRLYATDYQAPLVEYEAFSVDQAWMPNVVLMAKSTYVWLEQLSKKYLRHIHRLDQIPDEELRLMADRGITALWLIGLWERSTASRTIKRLRGHTDAVASAYSLKGYQIAEDLGGDQGYEHLKHRAAAAGLRLASDMVPNHMGIDSDWVIERPEMFIYRSESPFPVYSFEGPDLSNDSRVEIKIEDHYYDQSDAAVAFRLRHHADGKTRYMYHGNDGTTFAWNDTAQLDYSQAAVREYVIQTILHVARLFPIIRFDAAMVLAKRHVQRLWFPLPGAGGSIPSRAENAMSQEEFDAIMPHEFWREVVDRVAVEVPGTLLLAEAFWLLEGYFVRTLGMHRVYNSAFMNMLRDEENAKYRSYLKKTIEFDPDILKRYVNFMSNPDERTAIDQFGDGDKYFGVATLLATLPGLPMFAHGQIEGYGERYGMEFKQAKMDERPKEWLVERHQREIAPLLMNRRIFAESYNFTMYDFWNEHGAVDENVFAYSNRMGHERSVILYNNAYESTGGTIHNSAAFMDKGSGELRHKSLAQGLELPMDGEVVIAYRDTASGLDFLRRALDFYWHGLGVELRGYQRVVLLNWRELRSTAEYPWDRLCDELQGKGVPNLDEALSRMRLRPLHDALGRVLSEGNCRLLAEIAAEEAKKPEAEAVDETEAVAEAAEPVVPEDRLAGLLSQANAFLACLTEAMGAGKWLVDTALSGCREKLHGALEMPATADWPKAAQAFLPADEPRHWAPVLAWTLLRALPGHVAAAFDELQLRAALAQSFAALGYDEGDKWRAAARVRTLLAFPGSPGDAIATQAFWHDGDVRWLAGVNESEGETYFNQEQFEELWGWMQVPLLVAGKQVEVATVCDAAGEAEYQVSNFLLALKEEAKPKVITVAAAHSSPETKAR
jgi:glycosidase